MHSPVQVSCHIDCRREKTRLVVHVAGRLGEADVCDLFKACAQAPQPIVELHNLCSVDGVGLDALMRIEQQGARLVDLPEYLRLAMECVKRDYRR